MKFYTISLENDILFFDKNGPEMRMSSKDGKSYIKSKTLYKIFTQKSRYEIWAPTAILFFSSCDRFIVAYNPEILKIFDVEFGECLYSSKGDFILKGEIDLNKEISRKWTQLRLCHALLVENYTLLDSTLFFTIDEFTN